MTLVKVQVQFDLPQETLFLSLSTLDRFLQEEGQKTHKDQLQLVGVTAMFIACKVEEVFMPDISDFVLITDNTYNKQNIKNVEDPQDSQLQTVQPTSSQLPVPVMSRRPQSPPVTIHPGAEPAGLCPGISSSLSGCSGSSATIQGLARISQQSNKCLLSTAAAACHAEDGCCLARSRGSLPTGCQEQILSTQVWRSGTAGGGCRISSLGGDGQEIESPPRLCLVRSHIFSC